MDHDLESLVLYCDNHLLVLNKPAGMLTQPNRSCETSLEELGKKWIKKKYNKPGNVFLEAIHRLDKPVSGVVVFARTSKSLSRLQLENRRQNFQKHYYAVVEGNISQTEGLLEHYLLRGEFHTSVVAPSHPNAKKCVLKFSALKVVNAYTFVKIMLITGRYHQIRAQMAAYGHPIFGDHKYGSQSNSKQLFLHHASFTTLHPTTGQTVLFKAPFPDSWDPFLQHTDLCRSV